MSQNGFEGTSTENPWFSPATNSPHDRSGLQSTLLDLSDGFSDTFEHRFVWHTKRAQLKEIGTIRGMSLCHHGKFVGPVPLAKRPLGSHVHSQTTAVFGDDVEKQGEAGTGSIQSGGLVSWSVPVGDGFPCSFGSGLYLEE